MKTHYEILGLAASAPPEEIKRAFRREISKYHPDKVQHLGREFQEMAANIAADLTEAYRVLMDPALRAAYDEELQDGTSAVSPPPRPQERPRDETRTPSARQPAAATAPTGAGTGRATSSSSIDLVRKATLLRLRTAAESVLGADVGSVRGFDIAFVTRHRKALFRKADPAVRLLVKLVEHVDAEAVARIWPDALAAGAGDVIIAVLLLGYGIASPRDLSQAVTEQRQITGKQGPILIPVDVRNWDALFPADAPASLRLLLERLRTNGV